MSSVNEVNERTRQEQNIALAIATLRNYRKQLQKVDRELETTIKLLLYGE